MAYKTPTSRRTKSKSDRINLIPILDAVFIFIFFLLISTQYIKIHEIGSDVPIISNSPPPKNTKKPLALSLTINSRGFILNYDLPRKTSITIKKNSDGDYNLTALHDYLVKLKKRYVKEELIILEPVVDLKYEQIIQIMDSVRMLNKTDDPIYKKDKDNINVQIKTLFSKIIFGNLMS